MANESIQELEKDLREPEEIGEDAEEIKADPDKNADDEIIGIGMEEDDDPEETDEKKPEDESNEPEEEVSEDEDEVSKNEDDEPEEKTAPPASAQRKQAPKNLMEEAFKYTAGRGSRGGAPRLSAEDKPMSREQAQSAAPALTARSRNPRRADDDYLATAEKLRAASKAGNVLGPLPIAGVFAENDTVYAILLDHGIEIRIPFEEFYVNLRLREENREQMLRGQQNRLVRHMGEFPGEQMSVNFVVTDFQAIKDDSVPGRFRYTAIASRKRALLAAQKRDFNRNARTRLEQNMIVDAEIIAYTANGQGLLISFGGVDAVLHREDLTSGAYITDVKTVIDPNTRDRKYRIGSTIPVMITELERDGTGNLKNVEFSAIAVEQQKENFRCSLLRVGSIVFYSVLSVSQNMNNGKTNYAVLLPQYGLRAVSNTMYTSRENMSRSISPGTCGNCEILKIDKDKGMVFVRIITTTG